MGHFAASASGLVPHNPPATDEISSKTIQIVNPKTLFGRYIIAAASAIDNIIEEFFRRYNDDRKPNYAMDEVGAAPSISDPFKMVRLGYNSLDEIDVEYYYDGDDDLWVALTGANMNSTSTYEFSTNQKHIGWHTLCVNWDLSGLPKLIEVYLDGSLVLDDQAGNDYLTEIPDYIQLFDNRYAESENLAATLEVGEVRIYNKNLDSDEIGKLHRIVGDMMSISTGNTLYTCDNIKEV